MEQHWQLQCSIAMLEGRKQRGELQGSDYKVFSRIQKCPRPSTSLTTHTLTHSEQLPVPQAPFMVSAPIEGTIFIFYTILLLYLFMSKMFRYTDTYHVLSAYSI